MSTPKRIRLSRKAGWKMPPNTVNVARPGMYGNPFNWKDRFYLDNRTEREAKECVQGVFARLLETPRSMVWGYSECKRAQAILDALPALRNQDVACWCRLCKRHADGLPLGVECDDCDPCHGDIILVEANR